MPGSKALSGSFVLFFKFCVEVSSEDYEEEEHKPPRGTHSDAGRLDASDGAQLDAGTAGDADAQMADAADAADAGDASDPVALAGPPGLYADLRCTQLAVGVRPYRPRFPFWSDGSVKERFVYLPPGAVIDARDPDRWDYPVGMRVYKTFLRDGRRIETRLLEKVTAAPGPDSWKMLAYAWSEDQATVTLVDENGRQNALGTTHDIPSRDQCRACHSAAGQDVLNGFSAIQLNHDDTEVSLRTLIAEERIDSELADDLTELAVVPGDAITQAALGTLHTNCGICHGGPTPRAAMTLRLAVGESELAQTTLFASAVGQPLQRWTDHARPDGSPYLLRIAPGAASASGIVGRMSVRGNRDQMPPLGTELVDEAGLAAVTRWIEGLSATPDREARP